MNRRYTVDIDSVHSVSVYDIKAKKIVYSRSLKSIWFNKTVVEFDKLPRYTRRAFFKKMNESPAKASTKEKHHDAVLYA